MSEYSAKDIQLTESSTHDLEMIGYLGRDGFGRVYLDTCRTNEDHLKNHVEGKERPGCRKYIEDLFPDHLLGKRILATINVFLVEHKESK